MSVRLSRLCRAGGLVASVLIGCSSSTPPPRAVVAPAPAPGVEAPDSSNAPPEVSDAPSDRQAPPGWLGVELGDAPAGRAGVRVVGVLPQSPAAVAGLASEDLITSID